MPCPWPSKITPSNGSQSIEIFGHLADMQDIFVTNFQPLRQIATNLSKWPPYGLNVRIVWSKYPSTLKRLPLFGAALTSFQDVVRRTSLSTCPGPLTSLNNNPDMPSGLTSASWFTADDHSPLLALHCLRVDVFCHMTDYWVLCTPWSYRQMHNYLWSHPQKIRF